MADTDDPYLRERLGLAVAERAEQSEADREAHRWLEANLGRSIEPWQARRIVRVLSIGRQAR